jgi:hypothetical protein
MYFQDRRVQDISIAPGDVFTFAPVTFIAMNDEMREHRPTIVNVIGSGLVSADKLLIEAARGSSNLLLTGEADCDQDRLARAIHAVSLRRRQRIAEITEIPRIARSNGRSSTARRARPRDAHRGRSAPIGSHVLLDGVFTELSRPRDCPGAVDRRGTGCPGLLGSKIIARCASFLAPTLVLLERIVNINSGTMNFAGVRDVGAVLRAQLDALGFTTRWVDGAPFGRAGHLVAEHSGLGPRSSSSATSTPCSSRRARFSASSS